MKLVRITTEDPNALFETKFNEDIVIEPDSQIALSNTSFDTVGKTIEIDAGNDAIEYQLSINSGISPTAQTLKLTHGTYTSNSTDSNDVMSQIQNGLNTGMRFNGFEIGKSFRVVNSDVLNPTAGKLGIIMKTSSAKVVEADFEFLGDAEVSKNDGDSRRAWAQTEGNAFADDSNKILGVEHWPLGCCFARCKIRALVDNSSANNGFRMWLTDKTVHELRDVDDVLVSDTQLYLQVAPVDGGTNSGVFRYKTSKGGATLVDSTKNVLSHAIKAGGDPNNDGPGDVADPNNDIVEFRQVGGFLKVFVYRNGEAAAEELASIAYDYTATGAKRLFWGISFQGDKSTTSVESLYVHFDPFAPPIPKEHVAEVEDDLVVGATPPRQRQFINASQFILTIPSFELRNYLGFANQVTRSPFELYTTRITSDALFASNLFNDSYVFELLNIDLESYDSLSGGKRNILKVIPAGATDANSVVDYEASNLTFIDVRNKFPLTLRNLKARILRNDLEPIVVRGLSVCTLLIRSKGEVM